MTTPINDGCRIRVIRALLGMDSRTFAAKVGISPGTLTAWEKSRATPQAEKRHALAQICQENGIGFLPSGFPVPFVDCLLLREEKQDGSSSEPAVR